MPLRYSNNNNIQASNIKCIGNRTHDVLHMVLTKRPFLHIITIIIYIIHIIFLFHTASTNLIAYFPLKLMGICFLHYWPGYPCLKVSFYSLFVSYSY